MRCLRCDRDIDRSFRACPHCGEPVTEFARRFTEELLDGKYRILSRLGAGGMGEVYKAEHTFLGATRVIKVIRPQISDSQDAHDRFLREARLATKVQHPNVATLHDFSALPDGSHYMVWEYLDGENLAQRLRSQGPLPPRTAVRLILQTLHGLDAIHRAGIVHRDISPENLMIARETDIVKIIDLGVAKVEDPSETSATRTGIFIGKLRYASPEQLGFLPEHEKIDGRADLYAVGMVLYETLAGRPPFEATSPHQYYLLHSAERELKPVELPPDLPGGAELQSAIARALQRDREKRFASAREFAETLEAVERSLPEPGSAKTIVLPMGGPTMPVAPARDTSHGTTVRTGVSPQPLAAPVSDATIVRPMAGAPPIATSPAQPSPSRSKLPYILIGVFLALLLAGVAAAAFWLIGRARTPDDANVVSSLPPSSSQTLPSTDAPPSQTTVDVTSTTEPATTTETDTTTTTAAEPIEPRTPPRTSTAPPPADEPADDVATDTTPTREYQPPEPEPASPEPDPASTYIEHGDEDRNDALVARARRELAGTTRIAVRGGAMQDELEAAIRDQLPHLEIVASAPVVIEFEGVLERQRLGRKTRYANASIRKNGRPVFRYLLKTEVYRAGDTPVEAFLRRMEDVLGE